MGVQDVETGQQAEADRLRHQRKGPEISACEATTVASVASTTSGSSSGAGARL